MTSAEASPIHRQSSVIPPLSGSSDADSRRPQRQALVSMNSGIFVGEEQPVPLTIQALLVESDILSSSIVAVEMQGDHAW